jgi:hypothetical protein
VERNDIVPFDGRFVRLITTDGTLYFGRLRISGDSIELLSTRGNVVHLDCGTIKEIV